MSDAPKTDATPQDAPRASYVDGKRISKLADGCLTRAITEPLVVSRGNRPGLGGGTSAIVRHPASDADGPYSVHALADWSPVTGLKNFSRALDVARYGPQDAA